MERKLATIRKIKDLQSIEGADKIEVATIDGWKVVVAKDVGHKIGDMIVYCEIDSFLPIREEFEFLRKSCYKKMDDVEGFRLRSIKLRGQVSQGLVLPMSVFGDFSWTAYEGLDVTQKLGIIKWEPPIPADLAGKAKGFFPSFLRKTNEERIQNLDLEWEELKKLKYYVTEKLDGSSATFYFRNGEFGVCSRNLELIETEDNTFWKVARQLDLENKMKSFGANISIQGELIGEGIQGNPYKVKGQTVRFFNLFDIDLGEYHSLSMMEKTFTEMGLEMVPVLDKDFTLPQTIDELLRWADGKSELNPNFWREGVVIRTLDRKKSFKVISNKFLIEEK